MICGQALEAIPGENIMHDLMIAMAFVGMVIAPAIVAANSSAEADAETEEA